MQTKKLIKCVRSELNLNEDEKMNAISSNSIDSEDDDIHIIEILSLKSKQGIEYNNSLQKLNEEEYVSLTVLSVKREADISQEYWNIFESMAMEDKNLP